MRGDRGRKRNRRRGIRKLAMIRNRIKLRKRREDEGERKKKSRRGIRKLTMMIKWIKF